VAEYKWWRIHAAASAGLQLAQGHKYKGLQAGAGLWLTLSKSSGLMVGGEILGRAGALDGEPGRTGYLALLGIAYKDEFGLGVGVTYLRGDGQELPRHSMLMGMNWSAGRRYKKPPPDLSVPPLWTHADFWYLFGYRDPIVAPDGWIWSDDGKQRLGQYGRAHPWLIQPLLGRRPLPVGAHVLWRPRDGAVRSLEGGLWTFAGYALPGLRLDQGRAIDQALAQAMRPPAPRPVVRLPHQLRVPQPGQFPPLSWYGLRGEPSRLEPARSEPAPRAEAEPPRTWMPPAPFNLRERPRWTTLHPEDLPPELRGPLLGVWSDGDGCRQPRPFDFHTRPQWSTPRPEETPPARGTRFTPAGKREVWEAGKDAQGIPHCAGCGVPVVPPAGPRRPGDRVPPDEGQVDHVVPRSLGGQGVPENGQLLCATCNREKGPHGPPNPVDQHVPAGQGKK
jgi:5-methylcytosine-specific restriction endonuclease McrA